MTKFKILWVDDEIDLLKPHIIFLEKKGYEVHPFSDGIEALSSLSSNYYDIVFLDENMPGMSGMDLLHVLKETNNSLPIVMITKNEDENIMEEAIGSQITDYLIKPVNPNQILLILKKILDNNRLINEKTTHDYQSEFRQMAMQFQDIRTFEDWNTYYKKLVYWELELSKIGNRDLIEILFHQKNEANASFAKFVENNYKSWLNAEGEHPVMSHTHFQKLVLPEIRKEEKVCWLVIDNFRLDQWKVLEPMISQLFRVEEESIFYSILPTATQYARNSMFAGLLPLEIEKRLPQYWLNDTDEGGKNLNEKKLLADQLQRFGITDSFEYKKILNTSYGKYVLNKFNELSRHNFIALVYNFIDTLSHAKTDTEVIKELVKDEKAYRDLTLTWFLNSTLLEMLKKLANEKYKVILTTDHGMITVNNPVKIVGDKNTSNNIRYKLGKNMKYNKKDVFEISNPDEYHLPRVNLTSSYVFAKNNNFLVYPNNYNEYAKYFDKTYQHGGLSMEEMIVPAIKLDPK